MVQRRGLYRYAVDVFIELLRQITGRRIDYRCNELDVSCWNNFTDTFSNSVGEEFVRRFEEFGMNHLFSVKRDDEYVYKVKFSWIFGKRPIERFNRSGLGCSAYVTRKGIKRKRRISLQSGRGDKAALINSVRSQEERFKEMYFNTKRGMMWCVSNTTLYFHKSGWCARCVFKSECKKILSTEYPRIFESRGYGEE